MSDIAEPCASAQVPRTAGSLEIRQADPADLDDIFAIERSSFRSPWPKSALGDEIEKRSWSRVVAACSAHRLVGFMVYWTVIDELHLLNLAVDPRWRRRGVGAALLEHLVEMGLEEHRAAVLLEVRASNHAAIQLYQRYGFTAMGVRRGYYSDSGEDALVMSLRFSPANKYCHSPSKP